MPDPNIHVSWYLIGNLTLTIDISKLNQRLCRIRLILKVESNNNNLLVVNVTRKFFIIFIFGSLTNTLKLQKSLTNWSGRILTCLVQVSSNILMAWAQKQKVSPLKDP